MRILITGAAGMLGRKLAERLAAQGRLGGWRITSILLHDVSIPTPSISGEVALTAVVGDLTIGGSAAGLVASRPDIIFHLAAVVSGEAETDFDKGYRVNIDGTRLLFDAIRHIGGIYKPRVVFASSVAVYGPPLPDIIDDDFIPAPQTSYGTQKAIGELLLADYTRRGVFDGIGLRLPTICVRPGRPNRAASGFFSNIIREPLNGEGAVLPVPETVRHWFASPRAAIDFLIHAASLDTTRLGLRRTLSLPGVSVTVGEQIDALRRLCGDGIARRIRPDPDPQIEAIVSGWPQAFAPERALALGFTAESSFEAIIRAHIEDERGGSFVGEHGEEVSLRPPPPVALPAASSA